MSYLSQLQTIILQLDIETNQTLKYHLKGTLLEIICCLLDHNFKMYDDIDISYKRKYNLSLYDDGIDIIDTKHNIIGQCKYYKPKSKISDHILGSFLKYIINLMEYKFKYNLYLSENVKVNKIKNINFITINENIINEWIEKANKYNIIENKDINKLTKDNIKLYNYQNELLNLMDNTTKLMNYYNIFCGCGKTIIMMEFINKHLDKKHLILVPTILLAEQFIKMFNDIYNITKINKCFTNTTKKFNNKYNIYICVYNSFDYINIEEFDYIFIDEAHHIRSNKIQFKNKKENNEEIINEEDENNKYTIIETNKIYETLLKSKNIKFFFSATLLKNNVEFNYNYSMNKAIEDNIICDFDINIHLLKKCDDFHIMQQIKLFTKYERILIYCNSINKIKELTKYYNENNISSDYIDGTMNINKRLEIINKLKNKKIRCLFSVNTLSEGIDIKCCDTCLFLDDRNSIVSVIQCIGRILRKSLDKTKGYLLFFTDNYEECSFQKYLKILHKYINYFNDRENLDRILNKIKIYNDVEYELKQIKKINNNEEIKDKDFSDYEICDNYIKEIIIEDVIKNMDLNDEDKIKICEDYYNEFKRLPKQEEKYKNYGIGYFIEDIKRGKFDKIKNKIENIYKCKLEMNKQNKLDDKEKIKLCKEFYEKNKRLPNSREEYKDFKIGYFIHHLKQGCNSHLKEQVEKIFKQYIKKEIITISDEDKIKLCQEFYNEKNRLPKFREVYKDFKIGIFIANIKKGQNNHLKDELNKIFDNKLNKNIIELNNKEKIKLCKEFYDEFKRLPKNKDIYKDFKIGIFIKNMKKGQYKDLKEEVYKIFNIKEEVNEE